MQILRVKINYTLACKRRFLRRLLKMSIEFMALGGKTLEGIHTVYGLQ